MFADYSCLIVLVNKEVAAHEQYHVVRAQPIGEAKPTLMMSNQEGNMGFYIANLFKSFHCLPPKVQGSHFHMNLREVAFGSTSGHRNQSSVAKES